MPAGPSIFGLLCHEAAVQVLNLLKYYNELIHLKLNYIVYAVYQMGNIRKKHFPGLPEPMYKQGYHYKLGLMPLLFSPELNSDASSMYNAFDETNTEMS